MVPFLNNDVYMDFESKHSLWGFLDLFRSTLKFTHVFCYCYKKPVLTKYWTFDSTEHLWIWQPGEMFLYFVTWQPSKKKNIFSLFIIFWRLFFYHSNSLCSHGLLQSAWTADAEKPRSQHTCNKEPFQRVPCGSKQS